MPDFKIEKEDFDALIVEHIDSLRASGIAPGIGIGESAPRFTLPNAIGDPIALDDRLAVGPVVVSFYRGAWCPSCNRAMHALQENLPRIQDFGASLIAISAQAPSDSLSFVERLGLGFDVLSDLDHSVIRAYRVSFELPEELRLAYVERGYGLDLHNADGSWKLPVPATFVLDRMGIVRSRHVDPNYRVRMDHMELLNVLQSLA